MSGKSRGSVRSRRRVIVLLFLLVALPFGGAGSWARAAAEVTTPAGGAADRCPLSPAAVRAVGAVLERWTDHRRRTRRLPGLALGLVCGDRLVWAAGSGLADPAEGLPAAPDTPFRIASVSKVFTATVVLALRDRGLLALDDPVRRHLPDFRPASAWPARPITVEDLLTHASGLPTNSSESDFNRMVHPTAERMMELLPGEELLFEPGTDYKYSNLGYAILGRLASEVTARPFEDLVEEIVLAPLGMESTAVHPRPGEPGARGHGILEVDGTRSPADFIELDAFTPAGGMASTVEDLARFVAFQLDPSSHPGVLGPETARSMQRIRRELGDGVGMGLGWGVDVREDRHVIYHSGGLPSQTSHIAVDLTHGLGGVALTNARDGEPDAYVGEALAMARLALDAGLEGQGPVSGAGGLARYAGRFTWKDWEVWTVSIGSELLLLDPTTPSPAGAARRLTSLGDGRFRIEGGKGDTVRVVLGPDGRPVRLELPSMVLFASGEPPAPGAEG